MNKARKICWIILRITLAVAVTALMLAISYDAYVISNGNDLMAGLMLLETPIAIVFTDMAAKDEMTQEMAQEKYEKE